MNGAALALCMSAAALMGCQARGEHPLDSPLEATQTYSRLSVKFYDDLDALQKACNREKGQRQANGCAVHINEYCLVMQMRPRDWRDYERLSVLGHEVMHCLGANHIPWD